MANSFKLSRFNNKCWFGNTKKIEDDINGMTRTFFNPQWKLWYCDVSYSIQTIQTMSGSAQQINKMIGIHKNNKIDNNILCAINGVVYKVENISKSYDLNGTDVLTLKQMLSINIEDANE